MDGCKSIDLKLQVGVGGQVGKQEPEAHVFGPSLRVLAGMCSWSPSHGGQPPPFPPLPPPPPKP